MADSNRAWVPVAALLSVLTGCVSSAGPHEPRPSTAHHATPLARLEPISPGGGPLPEDAGRLTVLAEFSSPHDRLLAYVTEDACGLLSDPGGSAEGGIRLESGFPGEGQGSDAYPGGPYGAVSGADGAGRWASLSCSRNAMVIDYVSGHPGDPGRTRGHATLTEVAGDPATTRIVVGDTGLRGRISRQAAAAAHRT
ncbi:hypothetical protein NPS70_24800 [Streptomyces sp. C10-9-1]|uniref:hypothetical protein n=1 Tax=Streptomyces sp. C10-9-1 TaxID=1859285 RepID=UPI0021134F33|nr:hypothetical protein [Streptomyces sp. C10-9-1]MCQ6556376.1 hypothetical protein [Streptomyces sp. C10-9-1]